MSDLSVYGKLNSLSSYLNANQDRARAQMMQDAELNKRAELSFMDAVQQSAVRKASGQGTPQDEQILQAYAGIHPESKVAGLGQPLSQVLKVPNPVQAPQQADIPSANFALPQQGPTQGGQTVDAVQLAPAIQDAANQVNGTPRNAPPVLQKQTAQSLTGDAFLQTLDPQTAFVVKLIGDGKEKSSTVLSRMKPDEKKSILAAVAQYKPDYSANNFGANTQFNQGKLGNQVRSFSVGMSHLNTLGMLADALDNGNAPLFNSIGNFYAKQTGEAAPTNFDSAKQIVSAEIIKAVVGAQGAMGDRETAEHQLSSANSPAQLKGVIKTYQALMQGQLGGLKKQYEVSTGNNDFEHLLTDEAKNTFSTLPAGAVNYKSKYGLE